MPAALILGASRGLGLEWVRQYRADGWEVIATARRSEDVARLEALGARGLKVDVLDVAQVAGLAWQLDGQHIDVCVVNFGVSGPAEASATRAPAPTTEQAFDAVMHTNVLGAIRMTQVLAPLLAASRATLAYVSSQLGSIAGNASGGMLLYRVSKAALNMVAQSAHAEFRATSGNVTGNAAGSSVRVLALHPGWVRTDMGGANADIDVQTSVSGMRQVIADPRAHPGGTFVDYTGRHLPW